MDTENQGLLSGVNSASRTVRPILIVVLIQLVLSVAFFGTLLYFVMHSKETSSPPQPTEFFAFQHSNLQFVKDDLTLYYNFTHAGVVNDLAAGWIAYFDNVFRLPNHTASQRANMTVVFDIDETSLNNWPVYLSWDYGWDQAQWEAWVQNGNATALNGTLALFQYLQRLSVPATFITGRSLTQYTNASSTYTVTKDNLQARGFTPVETLILRTTPEEINNMTADVYKSNHRRQISDSGVQIIGCVGDQVSDCTLGYTGYIMKIPNYFYFIV